jgi:hypothetical protein
MKKLVFIFMSLALLTACESKRWTSGFDSFGFKNGHKSELRYLKEAEAKFEVKVSSEIYSELSYPLTLVVSLNDVTCARSVIERPTSELMASEICELNLGVGKHVFRAYLESVDGFTGVTTAQDVEFNRYHGTLTYDIAATTET